MKRFKDYIAESTKPKYEDLLKQAKHHAEQEQYGSDVAGAHTPGGKDVTAHEAGTHTKRKIEVLNQIAKHYPDRLTHAMRTVSGE